MDQIKKKGCSGIKQRKKYKSQHVWKPQHIQTVYRALFELHSRPYWVALESSQLDLSSKMTLIGDESQLWIWLLFFLFILLSFLFSLPSLLELARLV
jgi:hypothetical protein